MILFITLAVGLIGIATTLLLLPFFKKDASTSEAVEQSKVSLQILQENLRQLESDYQAGHLTQEDFKAQKEELEKRTLDEVVLVSEDKNARGFAAIKKLPFFLALFIPLAVVGLYFIVGNPGAINPPTNPQEQQIMELVKQLENRLKTDPNNAQGWLFLARTYGAMNRIDDAKKAFVKSLSLDPNNSDALADLADLVAYQNRSMNQEALDLIQRALRINPKNPKALALQGTASFEKADYASAIKQWELAVANLGPNDTSMITALKSSIEEAKGLLGPKNTKPMDAALTISGKVLISPKVSSQLSPNDVVFVYAKAINGPKVPLAIIKTTADKLPLSFQLSDEQSMAPQFKLSQFKEVTLTARISKSGNAIPEKGDLIGVINTVRLGEKNVQLIIQDIQP